MNPPRRVVAIDLGAESGRVAAVDFDGRRITSRIVHRFPQVTHFAEGIERWDMKNMIGGVRMGLSRLAEGEAAIASVGVDAWGVDYGLIDAAGRLVDEPTFYRDRRRIEAYAEVTARLPPEHLYEVSGVQLMDINTLFSLASDIRHFPSRITRAERLVMMPDVFHHLLSDSIATEHTAASTTGCYDAAKGRWLTELTDAIGLPRRLLPEVVAPGTDVGVLLPEFACGRFRDARVIVPAAHDTASAVVATPLAEPHALYISSGTWSLVGVEVASPVITRQSRHANVTNEGGYANTIRLLRNVTGLWLIQSCRRQWVKRCKGLDYTAIVTLAAAEPGLRSLIDPNAPEFVHGEETPTRIQEYCRATGQRVPQTIGEIARCVFDSLALSYRYVAESLGILTGIPIPAVNIIGGGARNPLLSQLTADALNVPVLCGPVEAAALGNGAVQLATLGELGGSTDIRQVIRTSVPLATYEPKGSAPWDQAYERFRKLVGPS